MGFRSWLTEKASKSAETVIVQAKDNLQKTVATRVTKKGDALLTIGKLGLLLALMFLTGKELVDEDKAKDVRRDSPVLPSININNYFNDVERSNKE